MSYARFGWDGSDVYVFLSSPSSKLECCACSIMPKVHHNPPIINFSGISMSETVQSFYAETPQDMLDHLEQHVTAGDTVPEETFTDIIRDFKNLTQPIPEDFSY